jgi:hypothetical protein
MNETLNELNIKLKIGYKCKDGEESEVEQRLLKAIIGEIRRMEGLFTTNWLPWSKSYYFSVREVSGEKIRGGGKCSEIKTMTKR